MSSTAPVPDTTWEKFIRNAVTHVVAALPGIIRNGYHGGGIDLPPRDRLALPGTTSLTVAGFRDLLCPFLYSQVGDTVVDLSDTVVRGLDSLALHGDISFPVQDVTMALPLLFTKLPVAGSWTTTTQCQDQSVSPPPPPTGSTHAGTFAAHFSNVRLTLTLGLDPKALAVTSAALQLTDDAEWKQQPVIGNDDVTFGRATEPDQVEVLRAMFQTDAFRSKIRDAMKSALEGSALAAEIRDVLNQMLSA